MSKWIESWLKVLKQLNPAGRFCIVSDNCIGYLGHLENIKCPNGYKIGRDSWQEEKRFTPGGPEIVGVDPTWFLNS